MHSKADEALNEPPLTNFSSAGFSALINARLYDSVFIYTVLVTNILTIIFLDHAKLLSKIIVGREGQ